MAFRRKSGLQLPLSPHQIVSWLVFVYNLLVFFIQIFPSYSMMHKVVLGLAIGVSLGIIILFLGLLTGSNPSDPLVQAYLESEDQSYKKNLVESTSRHCNYCEAPVSEVCTKHCLRCNRCTLKFDHHCKFVNNCVGILNYKYFFMLICAVEVHEMIMTAVFVMFIVDFNSDLNGYCFFVFSALIKSVSTIGFNSYLLGFHLYLMRKKITTYDFIMGRKKKLDSYVNPGQNLSDTNINI